MVSAQPEVKWRQGGYKLVEKQTLDLRFSLLSSRSLSDSEVCVRHFHLIVWSLIFTYKI